MLRFQVCSQSDCSFTKLPEPGLGISPFPAALSGEVSQNLGCECVRRSLKLPLAPNPENVTLVYFPCTGTEESELLKPQSCTRSWPTWRSSTPTDALEQVLDFAYARFNRLHPDSPHTRPRQERVRSNPTSVGVYRSPVRPSRERLQAYCDSLPAGSGGH